MMKTTNWTYEQLKSQLALRKEIKDWIITIDHVHRRERYFMSEATIPGINAGVSEGRDGVSLCSTMVTDQDRSVQSRTITLRLFVHLPVVGRQGEVTKKLFPSIDLAEQIDQAVNSALETDYQAWTLPTQIPSTVPTVVTTDPRMAEDLDRVMSEVTSRFEKCIAKKRATVFNSAELFLSHQSRELHLSNGLNHRSSQSRIYTEAAFSFTRQLPGQEAQSDEYMTSHWAVSLDHHPVEKIFDETSEYAEHSLTTTKPASGKYSVIIGADVLAHLLHGQVSQLSALHSYNNLPFVKQGEELVPQSTGDLLSITLDPTLDFGANSTALSEQGLIQAPLPLVRQNRVVATTTDKQYGDYLGLVPTTVRGNLVVEPGHLNHKQLSQYAPCVIEILQFSGLFSDANSGTFSSEIRLARLYDNEKGTISYLKGGSLSGSISDNFKDLHLSDKLIHFSHFSSEGAPGQGYYGPEYALLNQVSIVG